MKKPKPEPHTHYHKDGSLWARGQTIDGVRMRSGYFESGVQVGQWTTYDKKGEIYKVTTMKPKNK